MDTGRRRIGGFLGGGEVVMMEKCNQRLVAHNKDGTVTESDFRCGLEKGHSGNAHISYETMPVSQPPTLRDQFAIAALTGLIGNWEDTGVVAEARLAIAAEAYAIADAMLIVRVR